MASNDEVIVISRKYDNTISRTWKCRMIEESPPLLVFVGEFDLEVRHKHLGYVAAGTVSQEYYWLDRWFNVFKFHEPGGEFRNYYCNIAMPPSYSEGELEYVDLDIDVLVWPDGSVEVLDRQDFESAAREFTYPRRVIDSADQALDRLLADIAKRTFPFEGL